MPAHGGSLVSGSDANAHALGLDPLVRVVDERRAGLVCRMYAEVLVERGRDVVYGLQQQCDGPFGCPGRLPVMPSWFHGWRCR